MSTMFDHQQMSYEDFGRKFFEIAVTEERVGDAIAAIAGNEFTVGPIAQGPGKIAKVTARVNVQTPVLTRHVGEQITFGIRIPLEIDMVIDLKIDKPRFVVFGDISLHVTSKSLRAEVLRIVAGVDAEIRRFIAAHVSGEIDSPEGVKAKVIDVAEQ